MRLTRGWTRARVLREWMAGWFINDLVYRIWGYTGQREAFSAARDEVEAILRAALREKAK